MYWALTVIGVVLVAIWFVRGVFNSHARRQNEDLQAYYDSLSENVRIDNLMSDYERVRHVQDKFND